VAGTVCKHPTRVFCPRFGRILCELHVSNAVVISGVNGKKLKFNAKDLGAILGVPAEGFVVYVREDKTVLRTARLLQLTQTLSQQTRLKAPSPSSKVT